MKNIMVLSNYSQNFCYDEEILNISSVLNRNNDKEAISEVCWSGLFLKGGHHGPEQSFVRN